MKPDRLNITIQRLLDIDNQLQSIRAELNAMVNAPTKVARITAKQKQSAMFVAKMFKKKSS